MKREHQALARAQAAVSKAREAHDAALATLADAEAAVADESARAWDALFEAVQDAQRNIEAARRNQANVEVEVATSARARNRSAPMLDDSEKARAVAARELVEESAAALDAAKKRFKAGVTAELLEELAD